MGCVCVCVSREREERSRSFVVFGSHARTRAHTRDAPRVHFWHYILSHASGTNITPTRGPICTKNGSQLDRVDQAGRSGSMSSSLPQPPPLPASASAAAEAEAEAQSSMLTDLQEVFKTGQRVIINGVAGGSELDGTQGTVVKSGSGSVDVRTSTGDVIAVSPQRLSHIAEHKEAAGEVRVLRVIGERAFIGIDLFVPPLEGGTGAFVGAFKRNANGEAGPAERSGQVHIGDRLVAVNEKSCLGKPLRVITTWIRVSKMRKSYVELSFAHLQQLPVVLRQVDEMLIATGLAQQFLAYIQQRRSSSLEAEQESEMVEHEQTKVMFLLALQEYNKSGPGDKERSRMLAQHIQQRHFQEDSPFCLPRHFRGRSVPSSATDFERIASEVKMSMVFWVGEFMRSQNVESLASTPATKAVTATTSIGDTELSAAAPAPNLELDVVTRSTMLRNGFMLFLMQNHQHSSLHLWTLLHKMTTSDSMDAARWYRNRITKVFFSPDAPQRPSCLSRESISAFRKTPEDLALPHFEGFRSILREVEEHLRQFIGLFAQSRFYAELAAVDDPESAPQMLLGLVDSIKAHNDLAVYTRFGRRKPPSSSSSTAASLQRNSTPAIAPGCSRVEHVVVINSSDDYEIHSAQGAQAMPQLATRFFAPEKLHPGSPYVSSLVLAGEEGPDSPSAWYGSILWSGVKPTAEVPTGFALLAHGGGAACPYPN